MDKLQQETVMISLRIQELTETGTLEMTNISREVRAGADAMTTAGKRLSEPRAILFGPGSQQLGPGEGNP